MKYYIILHASIMAVRRLFSREGKIFSTEGGGARTYFLPQKNMRKYTIFLKKYYFSQKRLKTYYFLPALAPLAKPPPLSGRPWQVCAEF
jgi:hypothetical protein